MSFQQAHPLFLKTKTFILGRISTFLIGLVLLAGFAVSLFAADTEYKQVRIETIGQAVRVRLPLTDVTGKVRPKQRTEDGKGEPVAPTKTKLGEKHYLEWQIGYDSRTPDAPNVVKEISFERRGETKYGTELTKILVESLRVGFVSTNDIACERARLAKFGDATLEEHEGITIEKTPAGGNNKLLPDGFARWTEKVPQFIRETEHGAVQIQLKPKQRAVGTQAMIYVCLPMTETLATDGSPRKSGAAKSKETVFYDFNRANKDFLFDIVRAFGMASRQHNEDMSKILGKVLEVSGNSR